MPVITLYYDDLEELIGADKETIIKRIPMIGADIERIEKDYIDIEFFPDRPDLYSVEGVARAMRGFLEIETGLKEYKVENSNIEITLDQDIKKIRPKLASAVVRGLDFNKNLHSIESLMELQEDLHWGVGRNRKKVSIGVHDLSNIKPQFRYTAVDPNYEFIPLDFEEKMSMKEILENHPKGIKFANILKGFDKYPIILDSEDKVLSFPPIINSTITRVTENTKDLFIEVTGLDNSVFIALNIVVTALAERGGKIESVIIKNSDIGTNIISPNLNPTNRTIAISEVNSLLGLNLNGLQIIKHLEKLRYGAKELNPKNIEVQVPAYRADILHTWDIIEDIAIGYGYDQFIPQMPETSTIGHVHPLVELKDLVREIMTGLGYYEVMPFTLTNIQKNFNWMQRDVTNDVTLVQNPISEDHTIIRTTILPNLLEILALNQHNEMPQSIFCIGEVVKNGKDQLNLAAAKIHSQVNFTEIKSIVESVINELIKQDYKISQSKDPAFLEGRCADIVIKDRYVGVFGEVHPDVILNFGIDHP
ncbi:MAG: phenylalanine--tRNA ligase subunit beta, partial [Methanosarcinales archaeon]